MSDYDSHDHRRFAGRLILVANMSIIVWTVAGGMGGLVFGIGVYAFAETTSLLDQNLDRHTISFILLIVLVLLGFFTGFMIGDWRSFRMKLEAQNALALAEMRDYLRSISGVR